MADWLAAIDALEAELAELERQAGEIRNMINLLCRRIGRELRYAESTTSGAGPMISQIKSDTFYGKKMNTAAREFLELRKKADLGPAKPREIFDALGAGGFEFEAKDETTALISLRSALRKNTVTFHKLPNGQYGLKAWYPNAKAAKDISGGEDEDEAPIVVKPKPTKAKRRFTLKGPRRPPKRRPPQSDSANPDESGEEAATPEAEAAE